MNSTGDKIKNASAPQEQFLIDFVVSAIESSNASAQSPVHSECGNHGTIEATPIP